MATEATLCHVINDGKLVLKLATRGVSKGKWNGPGGKIDAGETAEQNAIRETFEETGLTVKNLFYHGRMRFFFESEEPAIHVHLFSTKDFSGDIISTEEGEVKWFDINKIPYSQMWDDDRYWLRLMLEGKRFDADFHFDKTTGNVAKCFFTSKLD